MSGAAIQIGRLSIISCLAIVPEIPFIVLNGVGQVKFFVAFGAFYGADNVYHCSSLHRFRRVRRLVIGL